MRDGAVGSVVHGMFLEAERAHQPVDGGVAVLVAKRRKDIGFHDSILHAPAYARRTSEVLDESYLSARNPPPSGSWLRTSSVGVTPAKTRKSREKCAWS